MFDYHTTSIYNFFLQWVGKSVKLLYYFEKCFFLVYTFKQKLSAWIINTTIIAISILLFSSTFLLTKEQFFFVFFPILHHEESPEKPECNMATPPFCLTSSFLAKIFRPPPPPPPFLSILEKSNPHPSPFLKVGRGLGGGRGAFELC